MSAEDNKALARRYWDEVWSTGNVAMVDELVAPDSLFHSGGSINTRDNETRKRGTMRWRTSVPDLRATVEDIFAERDKVVVLWTLSGTHRDDRVGRDHSSYREASEHGWHGHLSLQGWQDRRSLAYLGQAGAVAAARGCAYSGIGE